MEIVLSILKIIGVILISLGELYFLFLFWFGKQEDNKKLWAGIAAIILSLTLLKLK